MDWRKCVEAFFEKVETSLPFPMFFNKQLKLDGSNRRRQWEILSQYLGKWNGEYLRHYEKISVYSPVAWELGLTVHCFHMPKCACLAEEWLYWMFLSADINASILNGLDLRMEENRRDPQRFFLKWQSDIGMEVGRYLEAQDLYFLLAHGYQWIDHETFLREFAQKKKRSYERFVLNEMEREGAPASDIRHMLLAYGQYEEYEKLFGEAVEEGEDGGVAVLNPQGMGDLEDDCMCYFLRVKDLAYLLCFEDYF